MSDTWFLNRQGKIFGPATRSEVETLLATKNISQTDLIAPSEDGPWRQISTLAEFKSKTEPVSRLLASDAERSGAESMQPASAQDEQVHTSSEGHPSSRLTGEQRNRYIGTLGKKGSFTGMVLGVVIAVFLAGALGWSSAPKLILVFIGGGVGSKLWSVARSRMISEYGDERLAEEYQDYKQQKRLWGFAKVALLVIVVAAFIFDDSAPDALISFLQVASSRAKCTVVSKSAVPAAFIINGEPDAGYNVIAKIRNSGKSGAVSLQSTLNSSEGRWSRDQDLVLEEGESREVKFGFHEPTVNATNVTYSISCTP
jgi:hypothetical protein